MIFLCFLLLNLAAGRCIVVFFLVLAVQLCSARRRVSTFEILLPLGNFLNRMNSVRVVVRWVFVLFLVSDCSVAIDFLRDLFRVNRMGDFFQDFSGEGVVNYGVESVGDVGELCRGFEGLGLALLLLNVRSVKDVDRFDDFVLHLSLLGRKPDVLVLVETWFEGTQAGLYRVPGFVGTSFCRAERSGGGVTIFINENFSFKNQISRETSGIENVQLTIELQEEEVIIDSYYRPPGIPVHVLVDVLRDSLGTNVGVKRIVVGDFNVDLNVWSSARDQYLDTVESSGFMVLNDRVTRLSSGSLVDHVLRNFVGDACVMTFELGVRTDHCAVLSLFDLNGASRGSCDRVRRCTNWEAYQIAVGDRIGELGVSDPGVMCDGMIGAMRLSFAECTTERRGRVKKGNSEWISTELETLMVRKENSRRSMRRNPLSVYYQMAYDNICEEISVLKRRTKLRYYDSQLGSDVGSKQKWKNLNHLLGRSRKTSPKQIRTDDDVVVTDSSMMADAFNEYFSSVAVEISPPQRADDDVTKFGTLDRQDTSFFLEPVTETEISGLIDGLSVSKAPGLDQISVLMVKKAASVLIPFLALLINEIFVRGIFPDCLKMARVTPVFKNGDVERVSNYRPIAVLSVIAKMIEACLCRRIVKFLVQCGFIHDAQYGFREKSSTTGACLEFLENVYQAIDRGDFVCATFFDCSKAFDLVPHDLLLQKLELAGIRGIPLQLLQDYLSNRRQAVSISGKISALLDLLMGVVQGSKMGPLLYLIFTNDVCKLPLKGKIMLYADDLAIIYTSKSREGLLSQVRQDMTLLSDYYRTNRLLLNISKSKVMFLGRKSNNEFNEGVEIDGVLLERVLNYKYLGLNIDCQLNFKSHVEHVARKVNSVTGLISRVRHFVPRHTLITLFFSLINSNIIYAIEAFGSAKQTSLMRLEIAQRRALKTIFGLQYRTSTKDLYARVANLNIFPVKAKYYLCLSTFMHKTRNGLSHCNIRIEENRQMRSTRHTRRFKLPKVKSGYGKRMPSYDAMIMGNYVDCLYTSQPISTTKNHVRNFLQTKIDQLIYCKGL